MIKVICIKKRLGDSLIVGKEYLAESRGDYYYIIKNEEEVVFGEHYDKSQFVIKEDEKIKKGLTFREVFANIKPCERYKDKDKEIRCNENGTIELINIEGKNEFRFNKMNMFYLIEPVDFKTALSALMEGKMIEDSARCQYKMISGQVNKSFPLSKNGFSPNHSIMLKRLTDVWYIIG